MTRLAKNIEDQLLAEHPELRAQGLRPVVNWVYDTKSPEFQEAWRLQMEAIRNSPEEAEIMDWIEAVSDWSKD